MTRNELYTFTMKIIEWFQHNNGYGPTAEDLSPYLGIYPIGVRRRLLQMEKLGLISRSKGFRSIIKLNKGTTCQQ